MSSILKALRKLEEGKSQRDELSTAVASDILRSSRRATVRPFPVAAMIIVAALLVAAGYMLAISNKEETVHRSTPVEPAAAEPVAIQKRVVQNEVPSTVHQNLPRLSGIIYQEDPENRMAIINDLPVMEGTTVEGYLVRDIRPGKIVLLRDGLEYSLSLSDQ